MATIVLTGASMGIGRALALAWARRGETLVLSARSERELEDVASEVKTLGGRAISIPGDVTDAEYRRKLVERAVQATGGIDVLVNNAGRGYYASFDEVDLDTMRALFELNVFAPLALAQLSKPHLERSRGTIVMLSSVAGVVAAPRYAAYSASKFALEAMSMAMRSELAHAGVSVVVVRPGPVATPFRANSHRGDSGDYTKPDPKAQSPEVVAERVLRAVQRGSDVDETSAFVKFASGVSRHAPPAMRLALGWMAKRPRED